MPRRAIGRSPPDPRQPATVPRLPRRHLRGIALLKAAWRSVVDRGRRRSCSASTTPLCRRRSPPSVPPPIGGFAAAFVLVPGAGQDRSRRSRWPFSATPPQPADCRTTGAGADRAQGCGRSGGSNPAARALRPAGGTGRSKTSQQFARRAVRMRPASPSSVHAMTRDRSQILAVDPPPGRACAFSTGCEHWNADAAIDLRARISHLDPDANPLRRDGRLAASSAAWNTGCRPPPLHGALMAGGVPGSPQATSPAIRAHSPGRCGSPSRRYPDFGPHHRCTFKDPAAN